MVYHTKQGVMHLELFTQSPEVPAFHLGNKQPPSILQSLSLSSLVPPIHNSLINNPIQGYSQFNKISYDTGCAGHLI